jgi:Na+-transporting methylmalonyl-CoA/oxaloacetate decarboxylase gamma subunit
MLRAGSAQRIAPLPPENGPLANAISYNEFMETRLRSPSLKILTVVSLLFAALVAVSSGFSFLFEGLALWIWAGASFFLLLILFAYLLYGYGRLARLAVRKEENGNSFAQTFKTNPMLRKMIASGFGAVVNFAMGVFYLALAYVYRTIFDGFVATMFFLAFYARVYLLSLGANPNPEKQNRGLFAASIFSFFIGLFLLASTFCLGYSQESFAKQNYIAIADAAYAFYKLISAIVTLVNAHKTKSALGVAYALIAFALSLYSMFALQATMFDTFSQGAKDLYRYGLFGYFATATILIIATIGLLSAIRKKKSIANGKEAAPQQKPE